MSARRWIALAVLAAVALACLLWGDGATGHERTLFLALASFGAAHASLAVIVTTPGYLAVLGPLSIGLALWLARARGRKVAFVYLAGTILARLLVETIKAAAHRPRPELLPHLLPAGGWSFPSGHAANSMAVLLGFALLLRHNPVHPERSRRTCPMPDRSQHLLRQAKHERCMVAAALLLALAIGSSRVLLAVHWPSDVIAGWALGAAAAILTAAAAERISSSRS